MVLIPMKNIKIVYAPLSKLKKVLIVLDRKN